MADPEIQPYQTLIGRLLMDQAFCQRLMLEPAEAIAGAELVDVDDNQVALLESMSVPERQEFVRETMFTYTVKRFTDRWGREVFDPTETDS